MIKSLRLHNFKCFENQKIDLAPLTLLAGLNGQGKSSVLQALLLLRQSFQQKLIASEPRINPLMKLALNGSLAQLGTGQDVFFEGGREEVIEFEVIWQNQARLLVTCQYVAENDLLDATIAQQDTSVFDTALFGDIFQYIPAERLGPRLVFETSNFQVREHGQLGVRGEYTTHYLSVYDHQKIVDNVLAHPKAVSLDLQDQVEAWLGEISPGTRLEFIKHLGIDLISLQYAFVTGKLVSRPYRSTNVGFGITYTLPILVAILSAQPGSLVIIENPEAHLHPKGQAKISELMARATSCGIQILVETHSDHVLNGIRIAVHDGILSPDDVCLHFFERRAEGESARSEIVSPRIDRNGRIDQWPDGFFDEWDKSLETLLMPAKE